MIMIGHKAECMADPIEAIYHLRQYIQKRVTIYIVLVDRLTPITPGGDVVQRTSEFYAERSSHVHSLTNSKECYNARTDPFHKASLDVYYDASLTCMRCPMRTTLNIDDQLLAEAQRICGVTEKTALVREGLRALIERESARRLSLLGGSEPQLEPIPRRRPDNQ
jgi:Arc/MetJ family transcription regulator